MIALPPLKASQAADKTRSDAAALERLFGEDSRTNLMELRKETIRFSDGERYDRLLGVVLPPDTDTIRIEIDFVPSYPAPPVVAELGINGTQGSIARAVPRSRKNSGGTLISPAIEFVETARRLDKLDRIREMVLARSADSSYQAKCRLALLTLIEIADKRFDKAEAHIRELLEFVKASPALHPERPAEAVAVSIGIQHPQTLMVTRDLIYVVYELAHNDQNRYSESWRRYLHSVKFQLDSRESTRTPPDAPPQRHLQNWHQVSRQTAKTCGSGFPAAQWKTQKGRIRKLSSHDHDYLYFAIPLTGNFEMESDLSTFGYRDIQLAAGSIWAGPGYDLKTCLNGNFRRDGKWLKIEPPLTRMFDDMRARVVVRDGVRKTFINGRKVFETPHNSLTEPWVAIHCPWYTAGDAWDLRISGTPAIPDEIELAKSPRLPGWLPYFDETVGTPAGDWRLETDEDSRQLTGSTVIVGRSHSELRGSFLESLLRYHRPMVEDGTIEYDFFYKEGECSVHPALGRLCFFLRRNGVGIHWITDGRFDPVGTDPANLTIEPENRRGPAALPLRAEDWNSLRLELHGNLVDLFLNRVPIYSRELEPEVLRTFGLFHYADQTQARVRNLRWRGDWPKELPPAAEQELADFTLEKNLADGGDLPVVFDHDFADGLPTNRFQIAVDDPAQNVKQLTNGVQMTRPGGGFVRQTLSVPAAFDGNFDVTLEFENFQTTVAENGEGNIHLALFFDDPRQTECRIYRKHYRFPRNRSEQLVQAAVFYKRKDRTVLEFPASPAEESNSGRMRIARRGEDLYYLYASADSPYYRLIHRRPIADVPTLFGGVKLVIETNKEGRTSAVWKRLTVRAETASHLRNATSREKRITR